MIFIFISSVSLCNSTLNTVMFAVGEESLNSEVQAASLIV